MNTLLKSKYTHIYVYEYSDYFLPSNLLLSCVSFMDRVVVAWGMRNKNDLNGLVARHKA